MEDKAFANAKKQCLSKVDRSKKGSIDEPVAEVVDSLNGSDHFFTTSSCSGRVAVFWQGEEDVGCGRKKEGRWLYTCHELAVKDELIAAVTSCPDHGEAWLKFEPMVLHVRCQSVEAAQRLLAVALQAGFRNSGVVLGNTHRYIVAVRSTHAMDAPLVIAGKLHCTDEYLGLLCGLANTRMEENFKRIKRLLDGVLPLMEEMTALPLAVHA